MRKYIEADKLYDRLDAIESAHPAAAESIYDMAYANAIREVKLEIQSLQREMPEDTVRIVNVTPDEELVEMWKNKMAVHACRVCASERGISLADAKRHIENLINEKK